MEAFKVYTFETFGFFCILCYQKLRIDLVVTSKKKSISKDIIQIKVDHPPSYPIFDKLIFDKF